MSERIECPQRVGSGRSAFHPAGVVWIVADKTLYLLQPLWIGHRLPPAFMVDEAIPGTPQRANLIPLLLVGLPRRFESATHPVQRISTFRALCVGALSELPRLAARKTSMGPVARGRHRTSMSAVENVRNGSKAELGATSETRHSRPPTITQEKGPTGFPDGPSSFRPVSPGAAAAERRSRPGCILPAAGSGPRHRWSSVRLPNLW